MEVNAIIRQLTIDMITDNPNPVIEWFDELWSQLTTLETEVKHTNGGEIIYFIGDDKSKMVFYHDQIKKIFHCDYELYWEFLKVDFDLQHLHAQAVTKILLERVLGQNDNIIMPKMVYHLHLVLP